METNEKMKIDFQQNNNTGNFINLDSLISKIKQEDEKNLYFTRTLQWAYIILIIIYIALIVFENPEASFPRRISGFFWIASFIAFALILRKGYREYKNIDYSLPVIEMLRNVAQRYSLKNKNKLHQLAIPILLMDIGLTLSFYGELLPINPLNRILIIQAVYIPVMALAASIGILVWRKKQKPLRDKALKLIEELEGK